MGEFGVSDKEDKKNGSTGVYGLGSKVQNVEAVPSKTMMMMVPSPHNHHIPQLAPFVNDPFSAAADADGPISMTYYINHFVNGASASASGAAPLRPLQPFHIPSSSSGATTYTAFKSSAGGSMAAPLGFPFTNAQWKELERQAMIYKYLMASVPVPPHLLIPTAASLSYLDSGFNLRFPSGSDAEPGRCRRTDGKKWRCSRDVAPNHKYCERHMHRGRPRSRKPVELQPKTDNDNQLIKRIRHDYLCFPAPAVTMAASNPIISNEGSSSQFLESSTTTTSQRYFESSLSLDNKFGVKAAQFDSFASVSSNKEPRGLEWTLKGDTICMAASDPEWQPLIQSKLGLNTGITCNNNASVSTSYYKDPLQHMNSYEVFSCGLEHHNNRSPLCPNPQSVKPRGFIDAWSNAETEENSSIKKNSAASNPKLSLSSLDLSMGGDLDEDTGSIHMGLGLMEPPAPWAASSTPGGPLAEVLRPTTTSNNETASASHPSSPSGVLQRTLASLSDSSSSSSPRVSSSRANSEMAFLFFNHT